MAPNISQNQLDGQSTNHGSHGFTRGPTAGQNEIRKQEIVNCEQSKELEETVERVLRIMNNEQEYISQFLELLEQAGSLFERRVKHGYPSTKSMKEAAQTMFKILTKAAHRLREVRQMGRQSHWKIDDFDKCLNCSHYALDISDKAHGVIENAVSSISEIEQRISHECNCVE